jgi:uncharacterized protein involved in exopolysaccharide biosynthesis
MNDEAGPYVRDDQVDFGKLLLIVWNRRWWVIASTVLFTCAFAALWYFSRPIYRATIIMVPAGSEQTSLGASLAGSLGPIGGLASLAGFGLGTDAVETEASLAVLRSREFTEKFIREKNLMPLLFEDAWDAKARQWKEPADAPTLARGFKYFDTGIRSISRDKRTGLVTMTIDWHDRENAAEWANELVARLNAEMRSRAIAKSTASVGFLEQELKKTPLLGTQEAINRLIEAQIKQRMIASVTHEYAFRVVDRALVPDRIDKIWPKGSVLLPMGMFLGGFIGVVGVLLAAWLSGLARKPGREIE